MKRTWWEKAMKAGTLWRGTATSATTTSLKIWSRKCRWCEDHHVEFAKDAIGSCEIETSAFWNLLNIFVHTLEWFVFKFPSHEEVLISWLSLSSESSVAYVPKCETLKIQYWFYGTQPRIADVFWMKWSCIKANTVYPLFYLGGWVVAKSSIYEDIMATTNYLLIMPSNIELYQALFQVLHLPFRAEVLTNGRSLVLKLDQRQVGSGGMAWLISFEGTFFQTLMGGDIREIFFLKPQ